MSEDVVVALHEDLARRIIAEVQSGPVGHYDADKLHSLAKQVTVPSLLAEILAAYAAVAPPRA